MSESSPSSGNTGGGSGATRRRTRQRYFIMDLGVGMVGYASAPPVTTRSRTPAEAKNNLTPQGGVLLRCRCRGLRAPAVILILEVAPRDEGGGLEE